MDEILLKVDPALVRANARAHRVVAHRQHARPHAKPRAQIRGDRRQSLAGAQATRAFDVHSEIAIAETEPSLTAQRAKRLHERESLVATPPAKLGIGNARQRVHHGVYIGRDTKTEMLEIVAGVADDKQLVGRQHATEAERQLGAPDTAGQCDHGHRNRSSSGGRTNSAAGAIGADQSRPRTSTTGCASAAWPCSNEAAAAISSAKADDADLERAAEQIWLAAQVDQAGQTGGADRNSAGAAAPCATETVADDHTDRHAVMLLQPPRSRLGRAIGITRQQQHTIHTVGRRYVGMIDPGIRHHESQPVLHDDQVRPRTHDARGLAQDHLLPVVDPCRLRPPAFPLRPMA